MLIEVARAGLNFGDTHQRENSYLAKFELPLILGGEVAGTTQDGRRVVAMLRSGGYAERAAAPRRPPSLPDDLDYDAALALLVQGLTAWHLYRTSAKLAEGESVVVISGAGGVGSLAVQLAKPFGAGRVIATASSEEKREKALELGADATVDTNDGDLRAALVQANDGKPVDVVLEMSGGRVFDNCLEALAPFGRLVAYGIASREQNELRTGSLMRKTRWWASGSCTASVGGDDGGAARGPVRAGRPRGTQAANRGHLSFVGGLPRPRGLAGRGTSGKLLLDPTA